MTSQGGPLIVLIDRHPGTPQNDIQKYKKTAADIYEYGAPHELAKDIPPVLPVFPKGTGGYITTDAYNLIKDPLLPSKMVKFAKEYNEKNPLANMEVVFQYEIIEIIESLCKKRPNIMKPTAAKTMLAMHSTMESIKFLRIWPGIKYPDEKLATASWMTELASHGKEKRQLFIHVDDHDVVPSKKYPVLDIVKSNRLHIFLKRNEFF
ncbi:hypothetical protein CLU79DRAFT_245246 [Phycomyces nitens]|nr:hypothetical protein CLU79DRAFT_245246 [Phycomyces nitens]